MHHRPCGCHWFRPSHRSFAHNIGYLRTNLMNVRSSVTWYQILTADPYFSGTPERATTLRIEISESGGAAVCYFSNGQPVTNIKFYNVFARNPTEAHLVAECLQRVRLESALGIEYQKIRLRLGWNSRPSKLPNTALFNHIINHCWEILTDISNLAKND